VVEGEVLHEVLRGHEDDPGPSALALRLMGAVHRIVLRGDSPELAGQYPSAGGEPRNPWPAFLDTVRVYADALRRLVDDPVQTNEPARCAGLLGGFLEIARRAGPPLRLLEVGASAGLNLRFDSYRYELGDERWGPADSGVVLRSRLWRARAAMRNRSIPAARRAGSRSPPTCGPTRWSASSGCAQP
jgi:hypothetical protein